MIRSIKHLQKFELMAIDGRVGSVDDFYFDDERWAIRYIVADTGSWLPGRRVLISPMSVDRTEWGEQRFLLAITRDQVKDSPPVDAHRPVSRQHEAEYLGYYGYPYYWGHAGLWGAHAYPMLPSPAELARARARTDELRQQAAEQGDTHLRSASEVRRYGIRATDGDLGHVEDFLFDDWSWAIRYLVVDTAKWWFGRHVLVAPEWIGDISWAERTVAVDVSRESLKSAPQYDRAEHVDRQWEASYYGHLQRPGYWLTADEARLIKEAQSYLQDEPERHEAAVERRSRPR